MKLMTNFVSATLLASSLTAFNVPSAFAQDVKQISMMKTMNSQDLIKTTFADFTVAVHTTPVENKQVILRQAFTQAALKFQAQGVTQSDLIQYATSDMNSAEAKAFKAQVQTLASSDLSSSEGQMLLEKILMSQAKGSNFLPCGVGLTIAWTAGIGAFVVGIVALASMGDISRLERQDLEKEKAAINSEISILQAEGVSNDSYLITTRRAELVQIDIHVNQLLEDKARNEKNVKTMGMIAGGLALVAVIGGVANDCQY